MEAKQVPLYEQLEDVPIDARLVIEDSDGMGATILAIGRMCHGAAAALRERLAQPEQEPVAWMHPSWIDPDTRGWANDSFNAIHIEGWVPVYTTPRRWQGLTEEEVSEILDREIGFNSCFGPETDFARAIEAKLKEKNT